MQLATSTPTEVPDAQRDAVATAALVVIRRALIEGVPITRARLAQEASVAPRSATLRTTACAGRS